MRHSLIAISIFALGIVIAPWVMAQENTPPTDGNQLSQDNNRSTQDSEPSVNPQIPRASDQNPNRFFPRDDHSRPNNQTLQNQSMPPQFSNRGTNQFSNQPVNSGFQTPSNFQDPRRQFGQNSNNFNRVRPTSFGQDPRRALESKFVSVATRFAATLEQEDLEQQIVRMDLMLKLAKANQGLRAATKQLESVIANFPDSEAANDARKMLKAIQKKSGISAE